MNRPFGHFNLEEQFNKMRGLFTGISTLIWLVGIGTLFAGVIGVSNIMLIVVKERTKEIGIQRSIGASPWKVISQIIMESVVLTSFSGMIGLGNRGSPSRICKSSDGQFRSQYGHVQKSGH